MDAYKNSDLDFTGVPLLPSANKCISDGNADRVCVDGNKIGVR
jgi:hypothetical protein